MHTKSHCTIKESFVLKLAVYKFALRTTKFEQRSAHSYFENSKYQRVLSYTSRFIFTINHHYTNQRTNLSLPLYHAINWTRWTHSIDFVDEYLHPTMDFTRVVAGRLFLWWCNYIHSFFQFEFCYMCFFNPTNRQILFRSCRFDRSQSIIFFPHRTKSTSTLWYQTKLFLPNRFKVNNQMVASFNLLYVSAEIL